MYVRFTPVSKHRALTRAGKVRSRKVYALDALAGGNAPCWRPSCEVWPSLSSYLGIFGLNVSSYARDVSLGKHTAEAAQGCVEFGDGSRNTLLRSFFATDCEANAATADVGELRGSLPRKRSEAVRRHH